MAENFLTFLRIALSQQCYNVQDPTSPGISLSRPCTVSSCLTKFFVVFIFSKLSEEWAWGTFPEF